jgi:Caudovirus prohead serine protease
MLKATGIIATTRDDATGMIIDVRAFEVPEHVPVLDSHSTSKLLGHLERAWIDGDSLMGDLVFTGDAGARAYRLVERMHVNGVSAGYQIDSVVIFDADGEALSVEEALERQDDPDLVIVAEHVILREVSITATPADPNACVRAVGLEAEMWRAIRFGEEELDRILHSDGDGVLGDMRQGEGYRRIELPRGVLYGAPEPILR